MQRTDEALPPQQRVPVLIADRRPIAARGLAATLEETVEFVVQASCCDVRALPTVLGSCSTVEAAVIDAEMFDGDASESLGAIRRHVPGAAVLLLTTRVDERLLEAISRERVSCVSAYSDPAAIVSALRALVHGETQLPPEVQRALADRLRQPSPARPRLTAREEQVLELAATGLTVVQIAGRLHISHSTAKTHLLRVYEKLEAPNRSAAVANAVARGVLSLRVAAA
jgi:DNA-binding NarL/FixJ family response regulator